MKKLFIIRHALPCPRFRGIDFDRPLGERGIQDCKSLGQDLVAKKIRPDVILSSPASRALTTAQIVAGCLDYPVANIIENRDWYLAPANTWLKAVEQISEENTTAMIFGHNPGMAEFARTLTDNNQYFSFPPLTSAHFDLKIEYWGELASGCGRLVELLIPNRI